MKKQLLFLSTFGTYPELDRVFERYQYEVTKVKTLRKALSLIKQIKPEVIVAEFVYAPTYGSQLSNFESLFAAAENFCPETQFVALTHKDDLHHLEKVALNVKNVQVLTLPVESSLLSASLGRISSTEE